MKARPFLAVLLAALLTLFGLGGAGWWLVWRDSPLQLQRQTAVVPRAARFVPRQADLALYLLSDGRQPLAYARAVAPLAKRRQAEDALRRLRAGAFAAAGLDYEAELSSWLAAPIALALFEPAAPAPAGLEATPGWLLALGSRDDGGARRFLQRFWQSRSLAGTDLQVSRYRGKGLISGRGAIGGRQPLPLATALIDDNLVLIASGRQILEEALDVSQLEALNQAALPELQQAPLRFGPTAALLVARAPALERWLGLPTLAAGPLLDPAPVAPPIGSRADAEPPESAASPPPRPAPGATAARAASGSDQPAGAEPNSSQSATVETADPGSPAAGAAEVLPQPEAAVVEATVFAPVDPAPAAVIDPAARRTGSAGEGAPPPAGSAPGVSLSGSAAGGSAFDPNSPGPAAEASGAAPGPTSRGDSPALAGASAAGAQPPAERLPAGDPDGGRAAAAASAGSASTAPADDDRRGDLSPSDASLSATSPSAASATLAGGSGASARAASPGAIGVPNTALLDDHPLAGPRGDAPLAGAAGDASGALAASDEPRASAAGGTGDSSPPVAGTRGDPSGAAPSDLTPPPPSSDDPPAAASLPAAGRSAGSSSPGVEPSADRPRRRDLRDAAAVRRWPRGFGAAAPAFAAAPPDEGGAHRPSSQPALAALPGSGLSPLDSEAARALATSPRGLVLALRPEGRGLWLQADLSLGGPPPLPGGSGGDDQLVLEGLEAGLRGPIHSLAVLRNPAAWRRLLPLRPWIDQLVGGRRAGPLPALVLAADEGLLVAADGPHGWQLGTAAETPPVQSLEAPLAATGLIAAPLEQADRSLLVWTRLQATPARSGRQGGDRADQLQASLAGWWTREGQLAWWGRSLALLREDPAGPERRRQLEALERPHAPLQWALDGDAARLLLRDWQPWRLLTALAGGGLEGSITGLAVAVEPSSAGLALRARLELG